MRGLTDLFPWNQRALLWQFAKRDVLARYRGSMLGLAWSFLTPLLMIAVYTFVFREVLKARWPGGSDSAIEFALRVYAGLIVFNFFAEIVSRAPTLITGQPNLVKKVVFPLQLLPWVSLLAGLFHAALNLLVLFGVAWAVGQPAHAAWLATPLILGAFMPFLLGLSWLLSSLGVYLRDIGQAIGMLISVLMFLTPIFYPASALPRAFQPWLWLNPLTLVVEQLRAAILDGQWPDWTALGLYALAAIVFAYLCLRWFQATRRGFADVL